MMDGQNIKVNLIRVTMAKKYSNKSRVEMINKKFNENIQEFLKQSYINIIMTLDYSTYKVSSKGNGLIGTITVDGKDFYVNDVFYDQSTKGVVFTLLPNDYKWEEFWVDEWNCNKFTLSDFISMTKMLMDYFKTGKVYGFDEETNKPMGTIRINETRRDSYKSNIKLIESSIKVLDNVKSYVDKGILNEDEQQND